MNELISNNFYTMMIFFPIIFFIIYFIVMGIGIFVVICDWKVYKKAGKNGWEAIVPVYNFIVLLDIVNLPIEYLAYLFIPIYNFYILYKINVKLAQCFGKDDSFGLGLFLLNPIFIAILALKKDCVYTRPNN